MKIHLLQQNALSAPKNVPLVKIRQSVTPVGEKHVIVILQPVPVGKDTMIKQTNQIVYHVWQDVKYAPNPQVVLPVFPIETLPLTVLVILDIMVLRISLNVSNVLQVVRIAQISILVRVVSQGQTGLLSAQFVNVTKTTNI